MKLTILCDNLTNGTLLCEWGLSLHISHNKKSILLDCGQSAGFAINADSIGVDISAVDYGVLSHAHYDHSDGMEEFFRRNTKATFFVREGAEENLYDIKLPKYKYIGMKKGLSKKYGDRISYVSGDVEICDGIFLIPHKGEGLEHIGKSVNMYKRHGLRFTPDDFSHEQSLVIRNENGINIFSSCSHIGADIIITEIAEVFPNERIYSMVGGFHLYKKTDDEVREFAERVENTGIERIITGHCTGDRAYEILRETLGEKVSQMYSGFETEI